MTAATTEKKKSWRSDRTSAGVPRISKNLSVLNKKFVELIPESLQIINDVIVPKYEEVDGKQVKIFPDKTQVDLAKWVVQQQIGIEKEVISNKLRKLELAVKEALAKKEGIVSEKDKQEEAKEFGGPRSVDLSDYEDED